MKVKRLLGSILLVAMPFHAVCADEQAERLLNQVQSNLARLQTGTVEFSGTFNDRRPQRTTSLTFSATLRFMKPNFAEIHYEETSSGTVTGNLQRMESVSDGSNLWICDLNKNEYRIDAVFPDGGNIEISHHVLPGMFFNSRVPHTEVSPRLIGVETNNGELFQVIEFREDDPSNPALPPIIRQRIYIGTDHLVHRFVNEQASGKYVDVCEFRYARLNEPMTPASFSYHPPAGATLHVSTSAPTPLLVSGTPAPDFTFNDVHRQPVKLSDFRGKVVVLDFWATWCGSCIEALPEENAMAKKFKDSVVVLAVNVWDKPESFNRWLANNPQYDALTFAIESANQGDHAASKLYLLQGLPTVYFINKEGRIVNGCAGYDPRALEAAIKSAD